MQTKPFGRIVNYRWPHHTEDLMKKALAVYANRDSANIQTEMLDPSDEIITKPYEEVKGDLKQVVDQLADYSDDFTRTPDITNPNKVEEMYSTLRKYNHLMAMIKQDDKYDDEHPEKLLNEVGIDIDTEEVLTTTLTNEIKNKISVIHNVDVSQIDLKMEHVKAIRVNYDYLEELIADLMNQYHDQDIDSANKTAKEIKTISDKVDDRKYAEQIIQFAADVLQGIVKYGEYPVKQKDIKDLVSCHNDMRQRNDIFDYKKMWGLADIDSSQEINKIIENHVKSADDLNINGILDEIVKEGTVVYRTDADEEEVRELSRIKYRTHLRRSFKKFADKMVDKY